MSKLSLLLIALCGCALVACQETPVAVPLRSLKASGEVAFVCRGRDGRGLPIDFCPDVEAGENHLLALVTQERLGEVAVVDTTSLEVVDVEPTVPGFSFLPIGESPVDIVATPGGEATFVGVAAVGKEGIFALPTSCVGRPGKGDPVRDLTLWPACALPDAPGDMAILIEPPAADGTVGRSCDDPTPETDPLSATSLCPADLGRELVPAGRRKLAVALPARGQIAIIDAQGLLNRAPGSFAPCDVERYVSLQVDLPATRPEQSVPEDLQLPPDCTLDAPVLGPPPAGFLPRPAGFAVSDKRLYVADLEAPLVHVLDVASPCDIREQPPLLPVSFEQPNEIVTTSRVAVSPITSRGQQFVYAIDDRHGSVMAFDVTPGSAQRAPLVRPGTPRIALEPADRIAFAARAKDVVFVLRDIPNADPTTGVAVIGTHCQPDPVVDSDPLPPEALYRPTPDLSFGASPAKLRGVFAFVLLSSGQVAVIDVDDFDEECRRPIETNATSVLDFRGCASDVRKDGNLVDAAFRYTNNNLPPPDGRPTVSDELSCGVVQQHRTRSAVYMVNRSERGIRAPALRAFPRLTGSAGTLNPDQTDEGKAFPKLLAVDFPNPEDASSPLPAMVFVGTTLHVRDDDAENPLVIDPGKAERPSLVLPLAEPRSYLFDDDVSLVFEGPVVLPRPVGRFEPTASSFALIDLDAAFCDRGVEDVELAFDRGEVDLKLSGADLNAFAANHADFVQITGPLFPEDDSWWQPGQQGSTCGGGRGRDACEDVFGEVSDTGEFDRNRDFRILQAFQDHLVIEPRDGDATRLALLACCFPSLHTYQVRAGNQWVLRGSTSGFRHNVRAVRDDVSGPFRCRRDCDPRRKLTQARVFEIDTTTSCDPADPATCADGTCPAPAALPDDPRVFENLTARFAVYRGCAPSERDMTFTWTTVGSFRPLLMNLAATTTNVLPQSMLFVPQIGQLAVVDAASLGLTFVSLDTLGMTRGMQFF